MSTPGKLVTSGGDGKTAVRPGGERPRGPAHEPRRGAGGGRSPRGGRRQAAGGTLQIRPSDPAELAAMAQALREAGLDGVAGAQ
ncbi:hypothetical protein ACFY8Q_30835, partial [[Kitasatospora] papulosa]